MTRGDWLWLCIWRCVLVKHLVFLTLSFYLSRSAVIFLLTWQTLKYFSWTTALQNSAQSIKCLIYCLKIIPSQLYEQLFCFLLTVLVYFGAAMRWKVEVTTTHTLDFYALCTVYIIGQLNFRCLMGSTDQADPSCFHFRISWILMEWLWFNFFVPLTCCRASEASKIDYIKN